MKTPIVLYYCENLYCEEKRIYCLAIKDKALKTFYCKECTNHECLTMDLICKITDHC
jgi:hypothetical protein